MYSKKAGKMKILYKGDDFNNLPKLKEIIKFLKKIRKLGKSKVGCFSGGAGYKKVRKKKVDKLLSKFTRKVGLEYLVINKFESKDRIEYTSLSFELIKTVEEVDKEAGNREEEKSLEILSIHSDCFKESELSAYPEFDDI